MGYSAYPPASTGPTLSEITSAGNSAGWGASGDRNWTLVSSYLNQTNTSTISFTGLSGYKYYKLELLNLLQTGAGGQSVWICINNNNSSIYSYNYLTYRGAQTTPSESWGYGQDRIYFHPGSTGGSTPYGLHGKILIDNANTTRIKNVEWETSGYYSGNMHQVPLGKGAINTTSDITSIQIGTSGTYYTSMGTDAGVRLWGAN